MITEKIYLNVRTENASDFMPYVECFIPNVSIEMPGFHKRPAVIVCPGGGYGMRSDREGEPVALEYMARGFAAFVLQYSVGSERYGNKPARFPQQLCEACDTIALVRKNAEKWDIDPERIFILGFSAGGHLAASAVTMYGCREVLDNLGGEASDYRPNGGILCYPVISHNVATHIGSFQNLLGEKYYDPEMRNYLSLETHIDENTPECFIWSTSDDGAVPIINSLIFAEKLSEKKIKFYLEIFNTGNHGLSICNEITDINGDLFKPEYHHWIDESANWMKNK